jgi:acyl-CoA reductase-like NAD-dependent aldehyde dehydrogenase
MSIAELTGIDVPTGLLIGGEWSKGNATFPVLDPATEEPIAEVADGTASSASDCPAGRRPRPASGRRSCARRSS